MAERLRNAVSPYVRQHADNPLDWWPWSADAFAEAARRDVPVMISIGYATCHWCHVMARETFSDPEIAAYLDEHVVSIKVDREEHPQVDSAYLAAASAFTGSLGWPLTVFATPEGRAFYAGTYFPPTPMQGVPSFRQVLDAVLDAWRDRRDEVEGNAATITRALAEQPTPASALPDDARLAAVVAELEGHEDREFGGFGGAPKFPVATVLLFLLDRGSLGDGRAQRLAERTLRAMAASPLRDPVEGGFFRYGTRRDWSEPHFERMLYDNALLLRAYARIGEAEVAAGIARFLLEVLRLPTGGFASAQDSESVIDGRRSEGGYYRADAAERARLDPPALDEKVLTGWNGLAIEALAEAGELLGRAEWVDAAREQVDAVTAAHLRVDRLVRASVAGRASDAVATLEDYGMLAGALLRVATATGRPEYAVRARRLVDDVLEASDRSGGEASDRAGDATSDRAGDLAGDGASAAAGLRVPGGADPVLAASGLAVEADPSEGAYPSGASAFAAAAHRLWLLTDEPRYRDVAVAALAPAASRALGAPIAFGASLSVMTALAAPVRQVVVVDDSGDSPLADLARREARAGSVTAVATSTAVDAFADAGFALFAGRSATGSPAAFVCESFVCRLPVRDPDALAAALA